MSQQEQDLRRLDNILRFVQRVEAPAAWLLVTDHIHARWFKP